jgi:transcriptional regulator with XRE-family HTH domain
VDRLNGLGSFLRARREELQPRDVGLPAGGQRRTPGLRREEVAVLAGISTDYYLRLEQGRERSPSVQVLDALAGVLRLDPDQSAYLHALTRQPRSRTPRAEIDPVSPGTLRFLHALPMPALVEDRYLTVLAANPMATALSPALRPGVNRGTAQGSVDS